MYHKFIEFSNQSQTTQDDFTHIINCSNTMVANIQ